MCVCVRSLLSVGREELSAMFSLSAVRQRGDLPRVPSVRACGVRVGVRGAVWSKNQVKRNGPLRAQIDDRSKMKKSESFKMFVDIVG